MSKDMDHDLWGVYQDDLVAVNAIGCYEHRLIFVVGVQGYLVIPRVAVEEAK
jgi:hypothetical protein